MTVRDHVKQLCRRILSEVKDDPFMIIGGRLAFAHSFKQAELIAKSAAVVRILRYDRDAQPFVGRSALLRALAKRLTIANSFPWASASLIPPQEGFAEAPRALLESTAYIKA